MTYKKLFKMLDNEKKNGASVIDESIIKFGKVETMEAIDYLAYFIKTSTFKEMKYNCVKMDNKYKAIQLFSNTLKLLIPKLAKQFEYLAN